MGAPTPKVTWEKDGVPIEEGGRYSFSSKGLLINKTRAGDSGMYTCIAVNVEGRVEKRAEIQVSGECLTVILKSLVSIESVHRLT